jgi:hypothetical protein
MLEKPLADLLEKWMSSFSNTVEEEWLETSPPLHAIYNDYCIKLSPVSVLENICLFYFLYFSFSVQSAYQSEMEEDFDYNNQTSVCILNSCKSMVAWFWAAASLSRSKIFWIAE